MISRVKGTQDFLDLTLLNFLLARVKEHVSTYNFHEIQTPIIEHTELFVRSLGEYTDVVHKEMFTIATRDEQEQVCLRPEATAAIVRAFVENGIQQTPWKVFTYGPMFRYERPQKGRFRQFHHLSFEVIGSASLAQDVLLLLMLDRLFHEVLGLSDYALLINYLGCAHDRIEYEKAVRAFLTPDKMNAICSTCQVRVHKNLLRIFDCKNPTCQALYVDAPTTVEVLCEPCKNDWHHLTTWLSLLSISYAHQPKLVRGLDYYSKTVFEFVSTNLGSQNAFCAGGRYDQLVRQVGNKEDKACVGAAIGVERLLLLLEAMQNKLVLPQPAALYVVIPLAQEQVPLALLIADELLAHAYTVEVLVEGDSVKNMMKKANKLGAQYAIIIGEDEQQKHEVTLKHMVTGESRSVAQSALVDVLKG